LIPGEATILLGVTANVKDKTQTILILYMERGVVFGLALAPVIETRSGDIRVAEPFLYLGDVRLI
jgi:hypothetical protein